MTDDDLRRVLSGRQLIPDEQRDAALWCETCGRSLPVRRMPCCEVSDG